MKLGFRMLGLLLAVALLAVSVPQPAAAAPLAQTCAKEHTVASGDTLSALSVKYNVTVQEIATANKLTEPYVLIIGTKLCIPGATSTSTSTSGSTTSTSTKKSPEVKVTVVGKRMTISLANFTGKAIYYVRVKDVTSRTNPEIKLGRLRASKDGSTKGTFHITNGDLLKARRISVCLKNVVTDAVTCRIVVLNP
jgi:spore germination protein YaaH